MHLIISRNNLLHPTSQIASAHWQNYRGLEEKVDTQHLCSQENGKSPSNELATVDSLGAERLE